MGESSQVAELRRALEEARSALLEQEKMLNRLMSPPFAHASVVCVNENDTSSVRKIEESGTRVRIRRASEFARQNKGVGIVQGICKPGWVEVEFDNGHSGAYRFGLPTIDNGACDLEFADPVTTTVTLSVDGRLFEIFAPAELAVSPGDPVLVSRDTMQIIRKSPVQSPGDVAHVRQIIDGTFSEVDCNSATRVVFNGAFRKKLEKGDRIILDATGMVIVKNLGKMDEQFIFSAETKVSWDDIGGLEEAKRELIEAVELPGKYPEIFAYYHKRPVKGILFYGPPRCGKTMLAKAAATALARQNGQAGAASSAFTYIKGPAILSKFVSVAELQIQRVFERARKHKEKYGYPAIIFIDEADAILRKRGTGVSSDVENTIVPMFLAEMDGLEESGALVILATNRADVLDPAVTGDGRVDRKIKISRPDADAATEIFRLNLKGVPLNNGYNPAQLAALCTQEMFSRRRVLYRIRVRTAKEPIDFTLGHVINGGMIANVVDQATSIAVRRDLAKRKPKPDGLTKEDLLAAVDQIERQNRDLNYADDVTEFVDSFRDDVVDVRRFDRAQVAQRVVS